MLQLGGDGNTFRLTESGGAWQPSWNPQGDRIAYSDYDGNGIQQLYQSDPDGSDRIRLTNLREPKERITTIQWSPDGTKIAYVNFYSDPEKQEFSSNLTIINSEIAAQPISEYEASQFWWQDSDVIVVFVPDQITSPQEWFLRWIDITNSEIIQQLSENETPERYIILPGPLDEDGNIGFFSVSTFYSYDRSKQRISKEFELTGEVLEWYPAPQDFQGEDNCGK